MSIEWIVESSANMAPGSTLLDLSRRATEKAPRSAPAWYALAKNLFANEDFAEVVAATNRAVDLAPPTAGQLRIHAASLSALGRHQQALEALERHAPLAADPGLCAARGEALQRLDRFVEARAEFDAALAADPEDVTASRGLFGLLADQGEWRELLDLIDAVERRGASPMPLRVAKTQALQRLGRHAEARALLDFDRLGRLRTIAAPTGFDSLAAFNAGLIAELESPLRTRLSDRPRLRLVGGTQIEDLTAFQGPALRALFAAIRSAADEYFADVGGAPARAELLPWALVLGPDDYQARHYHLEAALAGVYYVAAPDAVLGDGVADGALVIPDPPAGLEGGQDLVRHIQPRPGQLVLFPGYLPHRTLPARKPGLRVSIAFNVVSREG